MPKDTERVTLRLPPDVHAALVAAAQANDRSLNGEIVSRLRRTLAEDKAQEEPRRS